MRFYNSFANPSSSHLLRRLWTPPHLCRSLFFLEINFLGWLTNWELVK
ncbi:hypothetical protein HanXRQr2_Chr05g0230271 [Helianthus annuus]|uniref:Uncharacterized protein n=1 Tax=Helianthus annuus TaxID=4232 RepID=A0A9K3J3I4_HELAN|nr:hypothetical protein HanXRQr2_Chr05g0230271 [Helianthus annuus]KAJ0923908.1 hypothetical protein HanPSC8_Chr05g0222131 [Helianthus annuus]